MNNVIAEEDYSNIMIIEDNKRDRKNKTKVKQKEKNEPKRW